MDRETARHELLSTPTASLYNIRKKWESQHTLSIAEWDVLAQYVQIGTEEEAQEPPLLLARDSVQGDLSHLARCVRGRLSEPEEARFEARLVLLREPRRPLHGCSALR